MLEQAHVVAKDVLWSSINYRLVSLNYLAQNERTKAPANGSNGGVSKFCSRLYKSRMGRDIFVRAENASKCAGDTHSDISLPIGLL